MFLLLLLARSAPNYSKCQVHNSSCIDYAKGKTQKSLWIVSRCQVFGRRELYVEEIKKYFEVDILGGCGDMMPCGLFKGSSVKQLECTENLLHKYKFYLAFENSVCDGYYTEKFLKTLKVDVIPVVFGAYNYSKLLPKGKLS